LKVKENQWKGLLSHHEGGGGSLEGSWVEGETSVPTMPAKKWTTLFGCVKIFNWVTIETKTTPIDPRNKADGGMRAQEKVVGGEGQLNTGECHRPRSSMGKGGGKRDRQYQEINLRKKSSKS